MFGNALAVGLRVSAMLHNRQRPRRPLRPQNAPIEDTDVLAQRTELDIERVKECTWGRWDAPR